MRSLIENFFDGCDELPDSVTNDNFMKNFIFTDYSGKIQKRKGSR
jgi:hypothetical protein